MSPIAAVVVARGPVDPSHVQRLLGALPESVESSRVLTAGEASLGVRVPGAPGPGSIDRGFLADPGTGVVVVMDGRVHAREDLRSRLTQAGESPRSDGDPEFVLRSYLAWGERFPEQLLGEYALAVWDPGKHQLVCARDVSGVRSLFYARTDGGTWWFASTPRQLLVGAGVRPTIDQAGLVDLLMSRGRFQPDRTLCASIQRVPPGSTLLVSGGKGRRRCHASYAAIAESSLDSPPDTGVLSSAIKDAIRDRVRGESSAALLLSGGWDSGGILALWARMRSSEDNIASPVTFTHYPEDEADERPQVLERLEKWAVPGRFVPLPRGTGIFDGLGQHISDIGMPETSPAWQTHRRIGRLARGEGLQVCLNGNGGDWAVNMPEVKVLSLLVQCGSRAALDQLRRFAEDAARPAARFLWSPFMRLALPAVLPGVWSLARRTPLGTMLASSRGVLEFLSRDLRALNRDLTYSAVNNHARAFHGAPIVASAIALGLERFSRELWVDRTGMQVEGVTGALPYMDPRVAGVAMAAATAELAPVHSRAHLQRAVESATGQPFHARGHVVVDRWLRECLGAAFRADVPWMTPTALADSGLVDARAFRRTVVRSLRPYSRADSRADSRIQLLQIWLVGSIEAWLREWA